MTRDGYSKVEEAVEAIADGKVIIVVDAEDREDEGDFVAAAEKVTPEMVNFMVKQGAGLFCATVLPELATRLQLPPAADSNSALQSTAFTVSVDAVSCKTGISAFERSKTVHTLINSSTKPDDLARPGHVFPIVAQDGGVLRRAGHTEASVDLCRMSGLQPAAVICEILDEDGRMARRDRLLELSKKFNCPIITIEDLIRYRRRNEQLATRVSAAKFPTPYGEFRIVSYEVRYEDQEPFALVFGDLSKADAPLIRMHSSCFTGDVLDSLRCECGDQLRMSLEQIAAEGAGALVYLPQEGRGIGLKNKLKAYALQDGGMDTVEANLALGYRADMRDYGIGIQILKDLGLSKVRLLTNNPKKVDAFIYYGYELEVTDQLPIVAPTNEHRESYMNTKRERLGHRLPANDAPGSKD